MVLVIHSNGFELLSLLVIIETFEERVTIADQRFHW